MARFWGKVGYESPGQTIDDVWVTEVVERAYSGNILENSRSLVRTDKVNEGVSLQTRISIIADAYAVENYSRMKYLFFNNISWSIDNVVVERPRMILTLGSVYDGQIAKS